MTIDELKREKALSLFENTDPVISGAFILGCDWCMDLLLPVLFFKWQDAHAGTISSNDGRVCYHYLHENFDDLKSEKFSTEELYKYWITNIYTP